MVYDQSINELKYNLISKSSQIKIVVIPLFFKLGNSRLNMVIDTWMVNTATSKAELC